MRQGHRFGNSVILMRKASPRVGSGRGQPRAGPERVDCQERKALTTLTSLNKESRPFVLGDNSIWGFPSVSSLSDCSIWRS